MNNDLISRTALISSFLNRQCSEHEAKYHTLSGEEVLAMIQNAPAIEALVTNNEVKDFAKENFDIGYEMAKEKFKRSQGEWTIGYTAKQKKVAVCNLCNCISFQGKTNFCHSCGADMRGGAE